MTETKNLTIAQLTSLADSLRCPDGLRTPFNSVPLPKTRRALVAFVDGFRQRAADSAAIERQGRR